MLEQSLAAMTSESADIGKMLFSDGPDQLAVIACIPDVHTSALNCEEWLQAVSQSIGATVVESTRTFGKLVVRANADTHPIKLKEPGITAAICLLKEKGLFPDEGKDDDLIFGDDDFPLPTE